MTEPVPNEPMSATIKWLIGGVSLGIAAIGAWVGAALRDADVRDEKVFQYLQQEVDKSRSERVDLAKGLNAIAESHSKQAVATAELTKATQHQTEMLVGKFDILITDQKKFPAVREAAKGP